MCYFCHSVPTEKHYKTSLKALEFVPESQVLDRPWEEADILSGKISHKSSLGEALLDKKKGDTVEFKTPDGVKKYKILGVE